MHVVIVKDFDSAHYNIGDHIEVEKNSPLLANGSVKAVEGPQELKEEEVELEVVKEKVKTTKKKK